jgi:hypothetical protein
MIDCNVPRIRPSFSATFASKNLVPSFVLTSLEISTISKLFDIFSLFLPKKKKWPYAQCIAYPQAKKKVPLRVSPAKK